MPAAKRRRRISPAPPFNKPIESRFEFDDPLWPRNSAESARGRKQYLCNYWSSHFRPTSDLSKIRRGDNQVEVVHNESGYDRFTTAIPQLNRASVRIKREELRTLSAELD
jgi:hypothetical protein